MALRSGFRSDINGLRALAVLAVVLYHFGFSWAAGGFIGVDVFFVISGFLMTGIIVRGVSESNFSILSFYLARARRIIPALLVVAIGVLVLGWFLLMPSEYQTLGKHARDSVLFSSNLRYLGEAGYFDAASEQKWLLHTWSLSVEWQFYLLYPLILLAVSRMFGIRWLMLAVLMIFFGSLCWSAWLSFNEPEKAFFTLSSRAWQMAAGGLVYAWSTSARASTSRPALCWLGLFMLGASVLQFDSSLSWPLPWSLLPVGAAVLIIAANSHCGALTFYPMQWIGDRSYSIYLWHWPVVVILAYFERSDSVGWVLAGIACACVMGHLSFRFIEEPGRHHLGVYGRPRSIVTLVALVMATSVAAQVIRKHDFPYRLPEAVARMEQEKSSHPERLTACTEGDETCVFGSGPVRAVLIGDSHAGAVADVVQAAASANGEGSVLFRGHAGCLVVFGARKDGDTGKACQAVQDWVAKDLPGIHPQVPAILVLRTSAYVFGDSPGEADPLGGRPEYYFSHLYNEPAEAYLQEFRQQYLETVCSIAKTRPLYVVRPVPEMPVNVPNALARDILIGRKREIGIEMQRYDERHGFVRGVQDEARDACKVQLLDPVPLLCKAGYCPGAIDDKPLYYDDDHLSLRGSELLAPMFRSVFQAPRVRKD
ncbi:acyltransferase family protein [Stutzerimonas chloritidismutans]|uniref:acyltransferase family protein n=1 Tax=Stutzerimonas chloritidismutans TaxID=203192 RepID=UPI003F154B74